MPTDAQTIAYNTGRLFDQGIAGEGPMQMAALSRYQAELTKVTSVANARANLPGGKAVTAEDSKYFRLEALRLAKQSMQYEAVARAEGRISTPPVASQMDPLLSDAVNTGLNLMPYGNQINGVASRIGFGRIFDVLIKVVTVAYQAFVQQPPAGQPRKAFGEIWQDRTKADNLNSFAQVLQINDPHFVTELTRQIPTAAGTTSPGANPGGGNLPNPFPGAQPPASPRPPAMSPAP